VWNAESAAARAVGLAGLFVAVGLTLVVRTLGRTWWRFRREAPQPSGFIQNGFQVLL
jgi:hypothetical protein